MVHLRGRGLPRVAGPIAVGRATDETDEVGRTPSQSAARFVKGVDLVVPRVDQRSTLGCFGLIVVFGSSHELLRGGATERKRSRASATGAEPEPWVSVLAATRRFL